MDANGRLVHTGYMVTTSDNPQTVSELVRHFYPSISPSTIMGQGGTLKEEELMIALIIHPKNETGRGDSVKWDEEYTLVVSDWYHRQHIDLLEEFMSWKNPTGAEPVPGTSPSL